MEFPAGAVTNFRMTEIYSTIHWKIYYIESHQLPSPGAGVLEDPSSALAIELESAILLIRDQGCLVDAIPGGNGLWVFSHNGEFDQLQPFSVLESDCSLTSLQIGAITFKQFHAEFTPLGYLIKRLMAEPQGTIFSPLSQQKFANTNEDCPINREIVTSSAFYKAFTSAIAGSLSLRATQLHGAIPLGKRALFTTSAPDEKLGQGINADPTLGPRSLLSTLNIEFSFKSLIISWRTIPQWGLQQLSTTAGADSISDVSLHEDIWLAPTGSLCRYIGADPGHSSGPQWDPSVGDYGEFEFPGGGNLLYLREWKRAVCVRLRMFGLGSVDPDTETWIEVEALNPFESRLGGTAGENRKSIAYKRFLWPARLCFKRSSEQCLALDKRAEYLDAATLDPLSLAEKWVTEMTTRTSPEDQMAVETHVAEGMQPEATGTTEKTSSSEIFASLARKIDFSDLSAGAVYPTPPGAVTGTGLVAAGSSDVLTLPGVSSLSHAHPQNTSRRSDVNISGAGCQSTSNSLPPVDITTTALEIGSGMYDTTADDDLFDELDGDFAPKQITEADFNFFDEPDFAAFPGSIDVSMGRVNTSLQNSHGAHDGDALDIAGTSHDAVERPAGSAEPEERKDSMRNREHRVVLVPPAVSSPKENVQADLPIESGNIISPTPVTPHQPLSPSIIRKILFSGNSGIPTTTSFDKHPTSRKARSGYEPLSFGEDLSLSDGKYELDGRFWFLPNAESDQMEMHPSDIPRVGIPEWRNEERRALPMEDSSRDRLKSGMQSSSDSSAESSEDDSEPETTPLDYSNRGLRVLSASRDNSQRFKDLDFTPSPLEPLTVNTEFSNTGMNANTLSFLRTLLFRAIDWTLDGYFTSTSGRFPVLLRRDDLIQVAQIVVDQVTQSSLSHVLERRTSIGLDQQNALPLSSTSKDSWYGKFSNFDIKRYTAIDVDTSIQGLRKDFRYLTVGSMSKLDPPHIRIHRGKGELEVLPPAIFFWEPFGFEPTQGQKDILAYCIYPESAEEGADAFLGRMGLLYSSANLGQHSRPQDSKGLIPWGLECTSIRDYTAIMNRLQTTCEHLGDVISCLPPGSENILVYIANPFPYEAAVVDICTAFLFLFRKYVSNFEKHTIRLNEVALQIIPLDFIASLTSLVVPSQQDYLHLAFEVYSRCPPKNRSSDLLGCAPPFTLAKPAPKIVPFKLTPDSGSPLAEKHSIHVAYSQSIDQRWVTAAWTDNLGRDQLTMTYCLRERGSTISRPASEIRADIWSVTRHIIGKSHAYWRVMVVKDEPLELDEAEAWVSMAQHHNQTKPTKIELTLLSVNPKPCLFFKLPPPPLQPSTLTGPTTSTPVSTPNPSMPSPDPSAAAPTPPPSSAEQAQTPIAQSLDPADSETILIDKTEETWSITLSHRVNISPSLANYHPALASGYLLRRRDGTSDTEGLASLCVNLIFTHSRIPSEMVLKDTLRVYRDLVTLARTKGIFHAQGDDVLPWHISTAVKGREFLGVVL
ncbi:hypothetical protein CISG_04611 [Coccidioides immitis RMSCC 3703]|uniref:Mediator of RNA polymerase II transcription subunit 13 n=2 Tax=Coccidioides immitis TaxID=5501 RepID=A0A0J8TKR7_COCIT|nr:hypothetical protein CIRG_01295 [Coccidioides immitis RMSCC 2394]KMU74262.1 hypothetical protein CISG_04611 [Coccidioides immitis RMSCC 3703]